jgi:hypothetical protein
MTFLGGPGGHLALHNPSTFGATIAGFSIGDQIDLATIAFGPSSTVSFTEAANNAGGTLTVTNGDQRADLTLLGTYATSNFDLASDGAGGTQVGFTSGTVGAGGGGLQSPGGGTVPAGGGAILGAQLSALLQDVAGELRDVASQLDLIPSLVEGGGTASESAVAGGNGGGPPLAGASAAGAAGLYALAGLSPVMPAGYASLSAGLA